MTVRWDGLDTDVAAQVNAAARLGAGFPGRRLSRALSGAVRLLRTPTHPHYLPVHPFGAAGSSLRWEH